MACRRAWVAAPMLGVVFFGCRDGGRSNDTDAGSTTEATTSSTTSDPVTSSSTTSGEDSTSTGMASTSDPTTGSSESGTPAKNCGDGVPALGELCLGSPMVLESGRSTAALELADLDGDDVLDLIAGHDDGVSVRFGNGDGTFAPAETYLEGLRVLALGVGNFGGDASPDIAAAVPAFDEVALLLSGPTAFDDSTPLLSGVGPRALAILDVDDDTFDDVVIAHEVEGDIRVAYGSGAGGFEFGDPTTTGTSPLGLAAGDIDGDERLDVVSANFGSGNLSVFVAMDGLLAPMDPVVADAGPRDVVVADFDDDGRADIGAIHQDSASAAFWPGFGDGSFGARASQGIGANPRDATTTDMDGDGIPDMIVALETGNAIGVLRGRAGEGLGAIELFATMSAPTAVAVGDLDGDSAVDVVTASAGPQGGIAVILAVP